MAAKDGNSDSGSSGGLGWSDQIFLALLFFPFGNGLFTAILSQKVSWHVAWLEISSLTHVVVTLVFALRLKRLGFSESADLGTIPVAFGAIGLLAATAIDAASHYESWKLFYWSAPIGFVLTLPISYYAAKSGNRARAGVLALFLLPISIDLTRAINVRLDSVGASERATRREEWAEAAVRPGFLAIPWVLVMDQTKHVITAEEQALIAAESRERYSNGKATPRARLRGILGAFLAVIAPLLALMVFPSACMKCGARVYQLSRHCRKCRPVDEEIGF